MTNKEKKELVKENFESERHNELVGFLKIENDIDGYSDFRKGTILVVYVAHTGDITYEPLDDMAGFIEEQENI